jgi:hypothetical protein
MNYHATMTRPAIGDRVALAGANAVVEQVESLFAYDDAGNAKVNEGFVDEILIVFENGARAQLCPDDDADLVFIERAVTDLSKN